MNHQTVSRWAAQRSRSAEIIQPPGGLMRRTPIFLVVLLSSCVARVENRSAASTTEGPVLVRAIGASDAFAGYSVMSAADARAFASTWNSTGARIDGVALSDDPQRGAPWIADADTCPMVVEQLGSIAGTPPGATAPDPQILVRVVDQFDGKVSFRVVCSEAELSDFASTLETNQALAWVKLAADSNAPWIAAEQGADTAQAVECPKVVPAR